MGTLQAKCRCGVQPDGLGLEPVALLGITHPDFVDDRRVIVHTSLTCVFNRPRPRYRIQRQLNRPLSTRGYLLVIEKLMRLFWLRL